MHALLLGLVLAAPVGEGEPRKFFDINKDIREAFRWESRAKTAADRGAAVREMCTLYTEIVRDSRLPTSDTLKSYKARLWSRLTKIKTQLERKIAREKKANRRKSPEERNSPGELANQASSSLGAQLALIGQTLGGPGSVFARGGGAVRDNGQAVVDLIQATIQPNFWDVNGGPGTIVYYAPLRVLVVRATGEVHGNVGGIVGGLRDAGR